MVIIKINIIVNSIRHLSIGLANVENIHALVNNIIKSFELLMTSESIIGLENGYKSDCNCIGLNEKIANTWSDWFANNVYISIEKTINSITDSQSISNENTQNIFSPSVSRTDDNGSQHTIIEMQHTDTPVTPMEKIPEDTKYTKDETFPNCIGKNCEAVSRLIVALKYEGKQDALNINILRTLEDFHHAIDFHENDILHEQIYNQIPSCNISECKIFKNSTHSILDKIHCFYVHSYDIGHRLMTEDNAYCDKCIGTDNVTNKAIVRRKQILCRKRKLNLTDRIVRYTELLSDNIYSFGREFRYGGEEKETKYEPNTFVIIHAKYKCLKEELTQNSIFIVLLTQFKNEYAKAIMHYNSRKRRQQYEHMGIGNILAILFYCDYDELQNKFSKTYRLNDGSAHCNFYHWGKLLKEAVHQHGTKIFEDNDARMEYISSKNFYHGCDKKLLPEQILGSRGIGVQIFCPLSTSSSLEGAINFTGGNNGLIIEFGGLNWMKQTKYFDCKWLSHYAAENECLFIQNESTLQIVNIKDPQTGCEYKPILNALKIFDQIVAEEFVETNQLNAKYSPTGAALITKIIHDQLSTKINDEKYCKFESLQPYGRDMIDRYFQNKESLKLNKESIATQYPFMTEILFHDRYQWIRMDIINVLFPNVDRIEITNIQISEATMEYIQLYTDRIDMPQITIKEFLNTDESELQRICNVYERLFEQKHFRLILKCKKQIMRIEPINETITVGKNKNKVRKNKDKRYSSIPQRDHISRIRKQTEGYNPLKKCAGYRLCFEIFVASVEIILTIFFLLQNANILMNSHANCHHLAMFTAVLSLRNILSLMFFCCNYYCKNGEMNWYYGLLIHVIFLPYGFLMLFEFEMGCRNTTFYLWHYCFYLMITIIIIQSGYTVARILLIAACAPIAICLECVMKGNM